jgi:hypothetical protein
MVRLDVDLGADVSLGSPVGTDVIIAPDGTRLVWVSHNRLSRDGSINRRQSN